MPPQLGEYRAKIGSALEHYENFGKATDRWTKRNRFYDSEVVTPTKRYKSDTPVVRRRKMVKRGTSRRSTRSGKRRRLARRPRSVRGRLPRPLTTQSKIITCKVNKYISLSNAAGVLQYFNCQLNSCDDPFTANGAGQPLGYDQWKGLYKRAVVLGSRITIQFHNRGTAAAMVGLWPAPLNQSTTGLSNYEYYMETAGAQCKLLSPEMDHTVVSASRSTKKHLQVTNVRDNAELSIDLVNETAPTKLAYWHVFSQVVDQAGTLAMDAVVTIKYIVLLLDPIIPARSVET